MFVKRERMLKSMLVVIALLAIVIVFTILPQVNQ